MRNKLEILSIIISVLMIILVLGVGINVFNDVGNQFKYCNSTNYTGIIRSGNIFGEKYNISCIDYFNVTNLI